MSLTTTSTAPRTAAHLSSLWLLKAQADKLANQAQRLAQEINLEYVTQLLQEALPEYSTVRFATALFNDGFIITNANHATDSEQDLVLGVSFDDLDELEPHKRQLIRDAEEHLAELGTNQEVLVSLGVEFDGDDEKYTINLSR